MARLLFALCLLFALPASAQTFNAQEQAEIRAVVRDYLVRNPDVLQEALQALQTRTEAERWQRIISDRRDFSLGPADAPIVIVEFYDYRCGYCHAALQWVTDITRTRTDVRLVLKELPILSPESMEAARAVIAAAPQGRTWQFHRALMSFPLDQQLNTAQIDRLARTAGIDVTRMRRAMESPEIIALLEDVRSQALDITASPATPLFMVNGEVISGFDRARLEARLREATREVRERGAPVARR